MSIDNQVLGFHLDGEGVAKLLNIAQVSLSAAAVNAGDAAQLGQVHSIRDALQAQIDALDANTTRITSVHVDEVSGDLAAALALGTYDAGTNTWDFNGKTIDEGDTIILTNATDSQDRSWIHNGGTAGDATDFSRLNSDLQAMVDAGIIAVTNTLRDGVPETHDTLNKLFLALQSVISDVAGNTTDVAALQASIATLTTEVASKVRAFYQTGTFALNAGSGVYELVAGNPANFENARVTVKEALLSGATRKIPDSAFIETTSDSQVLLQTLAPSYDGKEVLIIIEA